MLYLHSSGCSYHAPVDLLRHCDIDIGLTVRFGVMFECSSGNWEERLHFAVMNTIIALCGSIPALMLHTDIKSNRTCWLQR
jgi:hypothetical protein